MNPTTQTDLGTPASTAEEMVSVEIEGRNGYPASCTTLVEPASATTTSKPAHEFVIPRPVMD